MDPRLIIALDRPDALQNLQLVESLGPGFYKIGLGLLTGGGLALADELKQAGNRIFLDLKLFDIPATISAAVRGLAPYGLDFLTVQGDPATVSAARETCGQTKILAVTFLTSADRADLDAGLIKAGDLSELTTERARRAFNAGAHGVIASPREAAMIRALPEANGRLIVTPGIRLQPEDDDQKRTATPADALKAGADHIVIGRPIHGSPDPRATRDEIEASLP